MGQQGQRAAASKSQPVSQLPQPIPRLNETRGYYVLLAYPPPHPVPLLGSDELRWRGYLTQTPNTSKVPYTQTEDPKSCSDEREGVLENLLLQAA
jgi:hypothetical protein